MPQRSGLGKGLGALITTPSTTGTGGHGVLQISVDAIKRNPRQPRDSEFDAKDLAELAASIREHGIIQPLIVSPSEGETYTLIAGERRLRAAVQVGLRTVPAILRQANDRELLELALIENIQRAELNPLEEADAYRQLTEEFGLSHEEVAQRVGKSRPAVSNTMRLLQLSDAVKKALVESYSHADEEDQDIDESESKFRLSEGHARALLRLSNHQRQDAALSTVKASRLNVRQTEELVKKLSGEKPPRVVKSGPSPEIKDLQERLRTSLNTEVKLQYDHEKGGTITIRYHSDEELDTLLNRLL